MATSPAHYIGEQIGFLIEEVTVDFISAAISDGEFYVDHRHSRGARRGAKEVTMEDAQGNKHKLDIVIERGGSEERFGRPVAFIEVAWRRYEKHSKNKVQEISGAILPVVKRFHDSQPFQGAVLAGVFSNNSVRQLESEGFSVVFISYDTICSAFRDAVGLEIQWEENTSSILLEGIASKIRRMTDHDKANFKRFLLAREAVAFSQFIEALRRVLNRRVVSVSVTPLHGKVNTCSAIEDAVRFIQDYDESSVGSMPLIKYRIFIQYNTGDSVELNFCDKGSAVRALNHYSL